MEGKNDLQQMRLSKVQTRRDYALPQMGLF